MPPGPNPAIKLSKIKRPEHPGSCPLQRPEMVHAATMPVAVVHEWLALWHTPSPNLNPAYAALCDPVIRVANCARDTARVLIGSLDCVRKGDCSHDCRS